MHEIIYIADKHNDSVAARSLLHALPMLVEQGFDTLCVEFPSIPLLTTDQMLDALQTSFTIKTAITNNNRAELKRLTILYGKDPIDDERSIETAPVTYQAYADIIKKAKKLGITYTPIDVEFPTKQSVNSRNDHMEKYARKAIAESKTKKIIIFSGFTHVGNVFGGSDVKTADYNRGLAARLQGKHSVYFAYSTEDAPYDEVKKCKAYSPLLNAEYVRDIKIVDNDFQPFVAQIKADITSAPPPKINSTLVKYRLLQVDLLVAKKLNEETLIYIRDLNGVIQSAEPFSVKDFKIIPFLFDPNLLKKEVREKLTLERRFLSDVSLEKMQKLQQWCPYVTVETGIHNEKNGYFATFPGGKMGENIIEYLNMELGIAKPLQRASTSKRA